MCWIVYKALAGPRARSHRASRCPRRRRRVAPSPSRTCFALLCGLRSGRSGTTCGAGSAHPAQVGERPLVARLGQDRHAFWPVSTAELDQPAVRPPARPCRAPRTTCPASRRRRDSAARRRRSSARPRPPLRPDRRRPSPAWSLPEFLPWEGGFPKLAALSRRLCGRGSDPAGGAPAGRRRSSCRPRGGGSMCYRPAHQLGAFAHSEQPEASRCSLGHVEPLAVVAHRDLDPGLLVLDDLRRWRAGRRRACARWLSASCTIRYIDVSSSASWRSPSPALPVRRAWMS